MLRVFRPSSEVVKEGRIWKKIKQLQNHFEVSIWFGGSLVPGFGLK
jgi:hypothetical protein